MIIGIVADSHDNLPMLRSAVEHFNAEGCELVIHAGDVVAPFAMAALDGLNCPFRAIFGNNDGEQVGLKIKAVSVGGSIEKPPIQFAAGDLTIRVVHDCADWEAEAAGSGADVVVFGHTHELVVETPSGQSLPIGLNPGECGGWLTGCFTAAILDTDTRLVKIIDLALEPDKGLEV